MNFNPATPFYQNSLSQPNKLAISTDDENLSYLELAKYAQKISGWLKSIEKNTGLVGILTSRSIDACAGVLGTCWAGAAYVSISLKLPEERLKNIMAQSNFDALIVDEKGMELLSENVLRSCPKNILIPKKKSFKTNTSHTIREVTSLPEIEHEPALVSPQAVAYIIFTSGSTGVAKGVVISAASINQHVKSMQGIYALTVDDRVAQTSDLSFDISISNIFTAWNAGASIHIVPQTQAMAPAAFIIRHKITFWFSVPSIIHFMQSLGMLTPNVFPSLRCSVFAGEPLLISAVLAWRVAAPNSIIDNTYGPTEGTVVCVYQRLPYAPPWPEHRNIMALGKAFPGSEIAVVGENLTFLPPDTPGQIALGGGQVAIGYFNAPDLTASHFVMIGDKRWYLTGDKGLKDSEGRFYHLGRLDNQVKILGYRVELEDVEVHMRAVSGSQQVAAIAWPIANGTASGLVGFVSGSKLQPAEIREALKECVPAYMVPNTIHTVENFPMNANGKMNRKTLLQTLEKITTFSIIDEDPKLIEFFKSYYGRIVAIMIFTVFFYPFNPYAIQISAGLLLLSFAGKYRHLCILLMTLAMLGISPFWYDSELPQLVASNEGVENKINYLVLRGGSLIAFFLFSLMFLFGMRHFPGSILAKKPILVTISLFFILVALATSGIIEKVPLVILWSFIGTYSAYIWYFGYVLLDQAAKNRSTLPFQFATFHSFWVWGLTITPIGKGAAYLRQVEAKTDVELAVTQIKGLNLITHCLAIQLLLQAFMFVVHDCLHIPTYEVAFSKQMANDPYPTLICWASLISKFLEVVMIMTVWGNTMVACARMAGFRLMRSTYKPLQSRSITEFWNRFNFYFKELLLEFFFYPTFVRCFKNHIRLRIIFATLMAAGVGNLLFHFMWKIRIVYMLGWVNAVISFQTYAFYCLVLAAGIAAAQLNPKRNSPSKSSVKLVILPTLYVSLFYCFLHIFDDINQHYDLLQHFDFLFHLLGVK